MSFPDYAKTVKTALVTQGFAAVLEVDEDYTPTAGSPVVLVADDGGPPIVDGAWLVGQSPRRTLLRLTAFAAGRTEAHTTVTNAAEWVFENRPGIARVEDISVPLMTRDRATGAALGSITMPVIVRQSA